MGQIRGMAQLGGQLENRAGLPNLTDRNHIITSSANGYYNCIAWAVGVCNKKWWPRAEGGYHWPIQPIPQISLASFQRAFESQGFSVTMDCSLESHLEKLALYADSRGKPTHAARQVADGRWSSKLGVDEDIVHSTLDAISGGTYGEVALIMQRSGHAPSIDELQALALSAKPTPTATQQAEFLAAGSMGRTGLRP